MSGLPDLDLLKTFGQVAAPAGVAIAAFMFVARNLIARIALPNLPPERAYHVIVLFIVSSLSIALAGIGSYTYVAIHNQQQAGTSGEDKTPAPSTTSPTPGPITKPGNAYEPSLMPDAQNVPVSYAVLYDLTTHCGDFDSGTAFALPAPLSFPINFSDFATDPDAGTRISEESNMDLMSDIKWIDGHRADACSLVVISVTDQAEDHADAKVRSASMRKYVIDRLKRAGIRGEAIRSYGMRAVHYGHAKWNSYVDIVVTVKTNKESKPSIFASDPP